MDPKTLEALRGSIRKWENIVAGTGEDLGGKNCPLCKMFAFDAEVPCLGCPVNEATGEAHCGNPEYAAYDDYRWEIGPDNLDTGDPTPEEQAELTRLAQAELDFLKSLLPKEE